MIFLVVLLGGAVAQRGHYIVDYQRLPLYQEFYLSPGLYRPLFPAAGKAAEPRRIDSPVQSRHHKQHAGPHSQLVTQNHLPQALALQTATSQNGATLAPRPTETRPAAAQESSTPASPVVTTASPEPVVVVAASVPDHPVQEPAQSLTVQPQSPSQPDQPSVPVLTYSNAMAHDGSYSYKYETADGLTREESSVMEPTGEDGQMVATVRGSYSYPGPDGRTIRVDYIADGAGFRASGDHLPQSLQDTIYNFKYVIP